jgi:hypothetical protein
MRIFIWHAHSSNDSARECIVADAGVDVDCSCDIERSLVLSTLSDVAHLVVQDLAQIGDAADWSVPLL